MHKKLKLRLWSEIEGSLRDRLGLIPRKRASNWRVFTRSEVRPCAFVTAEYSDVAGGRFFFYFGATDGALPKATDAPHREFKSPDRDGLSMVRADVLGFPHALIYVDLDWQTPSNALVRNALALETARPVLHALGVTGDSGHHLLSHEVIEAMGIDVPDTEFDRATSNFRRAFDQLLSNSIVPAFRAIEGRWFPVEPSGST